MTTKRSSHGHDGELLLNLVDESGDPVKESVDIRLNHEVLSESEAVRNVDASRPIKITGLRRTPQGMYRLEVHLGGRLVAAQFVIIKPSGITRATITLPTTERVEVTPAFVEAVREQWKRINLLVESGIAQTVRETLEEKIGQLPDDVLIEFGGGSRDLDDLTAGRISSDWPDTFDRNTWYKTWAKGSGISLPSEFLSLQTNARLTDKKGK